MGGKTALGEPRASADDRKPINTLLTSKHKPDRLLGQDCSLEFFSILHSLCIDIK